MCTPPPLGMTCGFLINTAQSLYSHTKSALSFVMSSQQFTLCYFLVKSPLLRIRSCEIQDSLNCIPESKSKNFPDSVTLGDDNYKEFEKTNNKLKVQAQILHV